jgi:hypothetical protein
MLFAVALTSALLASCADYTVVVDSTKAPDMAAYGERAKALCQVWYPKINALLYGAEHPYFYKEVRIVIEPGGPKRNPDGGFVVAWAVNGIMHLPAAWLAQQPRDFDTVVVHELTHIVTDNYALKLYCGGLRKVPCFFKIRFSHPNRGVDWLQESIPDYVAFAFFTQRLEPRLRRDERGCLKGYGPGVPYLHGLEGAQIPIGEKGYLKSYSVGASFLLWLEQTRNKNILRQFNIELTRLHGSKAVFKRLAGDSLDRSWRAFLAQDGRK